MPSQDVPILSAANVTKIYETNDKQQVYACHDVSFTVKKGQTLGIVGESGCGKSTLARMLLQITDPTAGTISYQGIDLSTLKGESLRQMRKNIQAVFQDAMGSFNPKMKVREIICAPLINYGLIKRSQIEEKARELLEQVELPGEYADLYPFFLSGGERQRVGIARALALEPGIIVCDEATSALDMTIQNKIIDMLVKLQQETGVTLIFICHDLALVENICHKVMVMYCGNVVEMLEGISLKQQAKHPYTKALLNSVFSLDMDFNQELTGIDGEPPDNRKEIQGCAFYSRCKVCSDICKIERPPLREAGQGHFYACHLFDLNVRCII